MTNPTAQAFLAQGPRRGKGRKRTRALPLSPTAREPARQQPAPERQCASCRSKKSQPQLLQLAVGPSGPTAAGKPIGKSGRATYVCVARSCFDKLSKTMAPAAALCLQAEVEALAKSRFVGMLGLCRRQGALLVGAGRITDPRTDAREAQILAASDLADRTRRQLDHCGDVTATFLTAEALGHAIGAASVGAVGILPGRLGERAAYWLHVWYETRLLDGAAAEQKQESDPLRSAEPASYNDGRIEVAR